MINLVGSDLYVLLIPAVGAAMTLIYGDLAARSRYGTTFRTLRTPASRRRGEVAERSNAAVCKTVIHGFDSHRRLSLGAGYRSLPGVSSVVGWC